MTRRAGTGCAGALWRGGFWTALIGAAAFSAAVAPMARAQSLPKFSDLPWSDLSADDIARMNAAAARLYEGRSIGTVERWRNPDTSNAGSVKLEDRFETKGMPCWRMDYTVRTEQTKNHPSHYVINWCRTPSGEWKML